MDLEVAVRQPSKWQKVKEHVRKLSSAELSEGEIATRARNASPHASLRRALSTSPYERVSFFLFSQQMIEESNMTQKTFVFQLHYRYNRNLVDDDDQELSSHLRRRSSNAKRLTSLILTPPFTSNTEPGVVDEKSPVS